MSPISEYHFINILYLPPRLGHEGVGRPALPHSAEGEPERHQPVHVPADLQLPDQPADVHVYSWEGRLSGEDINTRRLDDGVVILTSSFVKEGPTARLMFGIILIVFKLLKL